MDHTIHNDLEDLLHEDNTVCPPLTRIDIVDLVGKSIATNVPSSSSSSSLSFLSTPSGTTTTGGNTGGGQGRGSSSPLQRILVTIYPHPHLYIPYPVQYEFRIPLSYPAVPPLVRCLTTEFIQRYAQPAQLEQTSGVSQLSLLNTASSSAVMLGGWSRTYTIADIIHCLRRTLLRSGPIVTQVQSNGKPKVYDIFHEPNGTGINDSGTTMTINLPSDSASGSRTGHSSSSSGSSRTVNMGSGPSASSVPLTSFYPNRSTTPIQTTHHPQQQQQQQQSNISAPYPTPRGASIPKSSLPVLDSGHYGLVGRRPTMEDTVIHFDDIPIRIVPPSSSSSSDSDNISSVPHSLHIGLYGVFDGHGGTRASEYAAAKLPMVITSYLSKNYSISEALHLAFQQVDRDFEKEVSNPQGTGVTRINSSRGSSRRSSRSTASENLFNNNNNNFSTASLAFDIGGLQQLSDEQSGCTAVVVVLAGKPGKGGTITVANAGDSRAILCRNGNAVPLSNDHKTERQDERARILSAGGLVIRGRVLGKLAVTRAIGDISLKRGAEDQPLVTAEPELMEALLLEEDEFLLLGCDGLFDVIDSQQACDIVKEGFRKGLSPEQTAKQLTQTAYEAGSADNISALVVKINNKTNKNSGSNGGSSSGPSKSYTRNKNEEYEDEEESSTNYRRNTINGSTDKSTVSSNRSNIVSSRNGRNPTTMDELSRDFARTMNVSHVSHQASLSSSNNSHSKGSYVPYSKVSIPNDGNSYSNIITNSTTINPSSTTSTSSLSLPSSSSSYGSSVPNTITTNNTNPYGRRRGESGSVPHTSVPVPSSVLIGNTGRIPVTLPTMDNHPSYTTSSNNNKYSSASTNNTVLGSVGSTSNNYNDNNGNRNYEKNNNTNGILPHNMKSRGRSISPMGNVTHFSNSQPNHSTNPTTYINDTDDSVAALIAGFQHHPSASNHGTQNNNNNSFRRRNNNHPNNNPTSYPSTTYDESSLPTVVPRRRNPDILGYNNNTINHSTNKNNSSTGLLSALQWNESVPSSSSSSSFSHPTSYTIMISPSTNNNSSVPPVSSSSSLSVPPNSSSSSDLPPIGGRRSQRSLIPSAGNNTSSSSSSSFVPSGSLLSSNNNSNQSNLYRNNNASLAGTNNNPLPSSSVTTTNNRAPSPMVLPYNQGNNNNSSTNVSVLPGRNNSTTSSTQAPGISHNRKYPQ